MSAFVALPRSINTGKRKVLKEDLLGVAADTGFRDAKTYLASGNLVLWGDHAGGETLEAELEAALERRLGLRTEFMVRTPGELKAIVADNPYGEQAEKGPNHLLVNFLKAPIARADVEVLRAAITGRETVEARERELYVVFPDGIGESMLDRDWKKTKRYPVGTTRNWNTVLKLAEMVGL